MKQLISGMTVMMKRSFALGKLALRKYSPEIALSGSIILSGAAVVLAVYGTKKVQDEGLIEETHEMLNVLDEDEEATRRDYMQVWVMQGGKFIKAYLPSFACWSASVALSVTSHREMKKRLESVTAAYIGLQKAYNAILEKNLEIMQKSTAEIANRAKEGAYQEPDNMIESVDEEDPRLFHFNRDTAFGMWENNPNYIRSKLERVQKNAQMIFDAQGYIMAQEVLEMLGMANEIKKKKDPEKLLVMGWLRDNKGTRRIDLGLEQYLYPLMDVDDSLVTKDVLLRFNCDWVMFDKDRPLKGALNFQ